MKGDESWCGRALKSGRIVCGNPPSVFDCVIRSLSERGARLVVPSQVVIADQLELLEASGDRQSSSGLMAYIRHARDRIYCSPEVDIRRSA